MKRKERGLRPVLKKDLRFRVSCLVEQLFDIRLSESVAVVVDGEAGILEVRQVLRAS